MGRLAVTGRPSLYSFPRSTRGMKRVTAGDQGTTERERRDYGGRSHQGAPDVNTLMTQEVNP